jgi:ferric-dicitrate binding protein FerR (iron transport regulator)
VTPPLDGPPPVAFPRLLDGTLSPAELDALNAALAADPALRDEFRDFGLQAVGLADHLRVGRGGPAPGPARRLPWLAGAAVAAAGVLGAVVARPGRIGAAAELVAVEGDCWRASDGGEVACRPGDLIRSGETVRTDGSVAAAALRFPDGTRVAVAGDSTVTVGAAGAKHLRVDRGDLYADVTPQPSGHPLRVETPDAIVDVMGTRLSVSRSGGRQTDVGVTAGEVRVTDRARQDTVTVGAGQATTVSAAAPPASRPHSATPPTWAVEFPAGRPAGCRAGVPAVAGGRAGLRAEPKWSRIYNRTHYQVIPNDAWADGLFQFDPAGSVEVEFRLDRPGPVQVVVVTRDNPPLADPPAQLYVYDGLADGLAAGAWHTVRVSFRAFHPLRSVPPHAHPVAYHVRFDSMDRDLGLTVARVRAGDAAAGNN